MQGTTFGPFDTDKDQAGYEAFTEWLDQVEANASASCAVCGGPRADGDLDVCGPCADYEQWRAENGFEVPS